MSDYDNSLKGVLFINDDKRTSSHPDYKGSLETEDGTQYWMSGWIKEVKNGAKRGQKFVSVAITPKDGNQQQTRATNRPANTDADDFMNANRAKADAHRPAPQQAPRPRQAPAPQPAPDFDSFDDDIPF